MVENHVVTSRFKRTVLFRSHDSGVIRFLASTEVPKHVGNFVRVVVSQDRVTNTNISDGNAASIFRVNGVVLGETPPSQQKTTVSAAVSVGQSERGS